MFQVAVAGPPLAQDPNTRIVTDSLRDFLRPEENNLRLLVPVTGSGLSLGVQAVVEWAWEREVEVAAVYQIGAELTPVENQFLEDTDESVSSLDAAQTVTLILKQGLPNGCLIVTPFGENYDTFTRELMALCFQHGIPVYDLSNALIEVDPYDSWENEGGVTTEEEKPEEQPQVVAEEPVEHSEQPEQPVTEEEQFPGQVALFEELAVIERRSDASAKNCIDIRDRARALQQGHTTAPQPKRHSIEISYDQEATWQPRKRGRAPADSVERDAVTKEILRRN